jgi:hypothetical protein
MNSIENVQILDTKEDNFDLDLLRMREEDSKERADGTPGNLYRYRAACY